MINTSMLAPVLPNIPNVVPFFAVLLLAMRFAYIHHYSISYLIFAPILLFAGGMVYYKTGNLNALMYMFLLVFLYKAEMESVLKIYSVVALFFLVLIVLFQTCNLSNHDLRESLFEIHLALFIQLILLLTVFIYIQLYRISLERNSLFYGLP